MPRCALLSWNLHNAQMTERVGRISYQTCKTGSHRGCHSYQSHEVSEIIAQSIDWQHVNKKMTVYDHFFFYCPQFMWEGDTGRVDLPIKCQKSSARTEKNRDHSTISLSMDHPASTNCFIPVSVDSMFSASSQRSCSRKTLHFTVMLVKLYHGWTIVGKRDDLEQVVTDSKVKSTRAVQPIECDKGRQCIKNTQIVDVLDLFLFAALLTDSSLTAKHSA